MKKSTLMALLIVTLMLPLVAVPTVRAQPTDLAHLVLDTIGEPQDIDPAWAYDTASAELLMNIYEPLLWFNRTEMATYVPRLAVSWTLEAIDELSPENLTWKSRVTFKLRVPENGYAPVYFHSDGVNDIPGEGAQLTAADVEYSFERLLITDAATGPSWMVWEPLTGGYWMGDLNDTLTSLGWPVNASTEWNTKCDEAIDHAIQQNGTHIWFNLVMPYEPFLQIVAQNWGGILNKAWCVWHNDWPGMQVGDDWYLWHDPETSPLYSSDPSAPGPNLDAALGTGPYMLDYWNKGSGNAWSIIKNPNYWMGWDTPFHPEGWPEGVTIDGHVERFTSNYIPEWTTRRLRFLGGISDFCAVPRMYMGQVLGQPGIDCVYPLPLLICDAFFFNFLVKDTSTHLGRVLPNSTFAEDGCPPNIFEDLKVRLAFAHLFDYATFLYAAFLNESVSPPTPIIPGLAYHDPSIGQTENPATNTRKKYGISFEPPDTEAYNLTLAVEYLQQAWSGQLWANGFTMDAVYNEGNLARQIAATLVADAFAWINAHYNTKFNVKVASIPWGAYRTEQRARVMPYFIVGWLADFPDAHNFAHPFMHSTGAFARWQGYMGITSFPNEDFDSHIEQGINTLVPAERQGNYTWLQQKYVDFAPGFVTAQAAGRHFERDWVEGWYYNPIYPGNYVYDLWKAIAVTPKPVNVAITGITSVKTIEIGYPYPDNEPILPFPSPIEVDIARLDNNNEVPAVQVVIGLGLRGIFRHEVEPHDLAVNPDPGQTDEVFTPIELHEAGQIAAVTYNYTSDGNITAFQAVFRWLDATGTEIGRDVVDLTPGTEGKRTDQFVAPTGTAKFQFGIRATSSATFAGEAEAFDITITVRRTREVILGFASKSLTLTEPTDTVEFYDFVQDPDAPIEPGNYTVFAQILVASGFAYDSDLTDNKLDDGIVEVNYMLGDVNVDGGVDMLDISLMIDAFMTYTTHPLYDFRCDVIEDGTVDMADISFDIELFMQYFDP